MLTLVGLRSNGSRMVSCLRSFGSDMQREASLWSSTLEQSFKWLHEVSAMLVSPFSLIVTSDPCFSGVASPYRSVTWLSWRFWRFFSTKLWSYCLICLSFSSDAFCNCSSATLFWFELCYAFIGVSFILILIWFSGNYVFLSITRVLLSLPSEL